GGGVLTTGGFRKARLAVPVALCAAMAGAPALALMNASAPPSSSPPHVLGDVVAVSASGAEPSRQATGGVPTTVPSEPSSTVPPSTSSTAVVARVRTTTPRTTPSTTVPRRTTTTARPAAKPANSPSTKPAPKPGSGSSGSGSTAPSGRTQSGGATWYDAAPPGTCAHKTLPMGTVVTIRASNGATAQCTVSDRGPYAE